MLRIDLGLALGGIPLGAAYALLAMGVVVVYKTARVFNFAQGALALVAAYVASFVGTSEHLPVVVSAVVGVAVAVAIAVLMDRLTIGPVRGQLPRTVVTLGWLLALQGAVQLAFGTANGRRPSAPLGNDSAVFRVRSLALAYSPAKVLVIVAAVAAAALLAVFFRSTALGTAMRAVADDPEAARLLGLRTRRVSSVAWGLGGGLAGVAGVLIAPLLGSLDTVSLLLLTIAALAAALVGRLVSLPWTFAAAIGLGMVQPVAARTFAGTSGIPQLVALLVALAALLARRGTGRGDTGSGGLAALAVRPLPRGRSAALAAAGALLVAAVVPLLGGATWNYNVAATLAWALAVLSIVLLTGVVGQISVCQAVFMATGGYGAAIALSHGVPFLLALPLGGLLAAAVAAAVAVPALRLRPLELAIVTLTLAFTADAFLYSFVPLVSASQHRPLARPGFADAAVSGHGVLGARAYSWLAAALFLAAAFAVASLRRGRIGAALTALRSSEAATSAMGFSVISVKIRGFAAAGFLAGVAGTLYAGLAYEVSPGPFAFDRSISLLAFAVIAGVGSVPGALLGGLVVTLSSLSFSGSQVASPRSAALVLTLTGLALVATVRFAPEGIAGLVSRGAGTVRGRPRFDPPVGSSPSDTGAPTVVLVGAGNP